MRDCARDLAELSDLPSDERLRALERIIPMATVQAVLRRTGHDKRHCTRLPPAFMTLFVVALGLFNKDSHRQVFKHLQRFRRGATPGHENAAPADPPGFIRTSLPSWIYPEAIFMPDGHGRWATTADENSVASRDRSRPRLCHATAVAGLKKTPFSPEHGNVHP